MSHEKLSPSSGPSAEGIEPALDDLTTGQATLDQYEALDEQAFKLQSSQEFRDDFTELASQATVRVKGVVLQLEAGPDTNPIYDAMITAKENGADTRLVYDTMSTGHVSRGDNEGNIYNGRVLRYKGDKDVVRQAHADRQDIITQLQDHGIIVPPEGHTKPSRNGHNHIKLFFADDVAWLGTMNLREADFTMSNFMLKITDPHWVEVLSQIYDNSTADGSAPDAIYGEDTDETQALFDGGNKGDSVIYNKALEMVGSLWEGDEVTLIGQYVPVKMMYGQLLMDLRTKMQQGVKGKFLLPPADNLHPVKWASRRLQKTVDKREQQVPGMTAINLARKTHIKAMLIKRANGEREVLFGSHNLTSWTVRIGNKEVAMWSKDPEIVDPIAALMDTLEHEPESESQ